MKKILFLLVLIYSSSFAVLCESANAVLQFTTNTGQLSLGYVSATKPGSVWLIYFMSTFRYECGTTPVPPPLNDDINTAGVCSMINGVFTCTPSPDPLGGKRCRDLFQKDGVAYTCNPNTNEATPIPNSEGTMIDPENPDNNIPKCSSGYEYTSTPHTSYNGSGTGYTDWGCSASTGTGNTGTGSTGDGTVTGGSGTGEPSISYGGDGSVTMTLPDGTKQTTYGDGTVTTTYKDGTTSTTFGAGHSSGGSGTSGGGGGTSGNTTNETTPTPTEDTPIDNTPIDNTPVASSCSDSALTLQEKMLCELNAGMKKQNSEASPENSLNQLLKDLKTSNQIDNTVINTNLKDIEAGTAQLVNKQIQANNTLDKINNSANATELYTKTMNDGINKISGTLDDVKSKLDDSSFSSTVAKDSLTSMGSDADSILSEAQQAYSNLSSTFESIKTNYQQLKDFVDGKKSENATINIVNTSKPSCTNYNIFGESKCYDCFFNQDLDLLFSGIRPFITFLLNIYFMYLSISLFMKYALANRGGIV